MKNGRARVYALPCDSRGGTCLRGTRRMPSRFDLSCHMLSADVSWSLTLPSLEHVARITRSLLPPNATQFTDWLCLGILNDSFLFVCGVRTVEIPP